MFVRDKLLSGAERDIPRQKALRQKRVRLRLRKYRNQRVVKARFFAARFRNSGGVSRPRKSQIRRHRETVAPLYGGAKQKARRRNNGAGIEGRRRPGRSDGKGNGACL